MPPAEVRNDTEKPTECALTGYPLEADRVKIPGSAAFRVTVINASACTVPLACWFLVNFR